MRRDGRETDRRRRHGAIGTNYPSVVTQGARSGVWRRHSTSSTREYYHTTMDKAELVPASGLQSATQAFAKIIDGVNRMDIPSIRADLIPWLQGLRRPQCRRVGLYSGGASRPTAAVVGGSAGQVRRVRLRARRRSRYRVVFGHSGARLGFGNGSRRAQSVGSTARSDDLREGAP